MHTIEDELAPYTCGMSDVLEENPFYWTVSITMALK